MPRFVIKWSHGDGCTFSCDETEPVIADSGEEFLVSLEDAVKKAHGEGNYEFDLFGRSWQVDHFYSCGFDSGKLAYYAPEVMTLDEWFDQYCN